MEPNDIEQDIISKAASMYVSNQPYIHILQQVNCAFEQMINTFVNEIRSYNIHTEYELRTIRNNLFSLKHLFDKSAPIKGVVSAACISYFGSGKQIGD